MGRCAAKYIKAETHPPFAEARALVVVLDAAARRDLPAEVASLWATLGAVAAADPDSPLDGMPDPSRPARRIIEIMLGTAHPIGYLIQEIHAEEPHHRLAMLLMAGMTGVIKATNAIDEQMAEILAPTRS